MPVLTRRTFLEAALASAAAALLPARGAAFDRPLAFMLHAVRVAAAADLPGTLRRIRAFGYAEVELVSFRGYAGPAARDGFAALAPMPPSAVRAAIADAGLTATSAHFKFEEFQDARLTESIAWAKGVGLEYMTVSDVPAATTLDDWKRRFETLDRLGERVAQDGLRLGLHTQNDFWRTVDGALVLDAMLQQVPAQRCAVQLDLSTTQSMGIDAAAYLARHPGRFFALHLRDAPTPEKPGGYVFSVPLGQGALDLKAIVAAAERAGIRQYIVEMQMQPPADPIEGLRLSADYLRRL
jgi:sugar phosphate isomerase/epimerase